MEAGEEEEAVVVLRLPGEGRRGSFQAVVAEEGAEGHLLLEWGEGLLEAFPEEEEEEEEEEEVVVVVVVVVAPPWGKGRQMPLRPGEGRQGYGPVGEEGAAVAALRILVLAARQALAA